MPQANSAKSVLVVEDDRDYSHLLRTAFGDAGFRTLEAENGQAALQVLRRESVDLVVSDFIMPELNGIELCRLVNSDLDLSRIKVVLYSCNVDPAFRQKARSLGAIEYLPKAPDAGQFVEQICELAGIQVGHAQTPAKPAASPAACGHRDLLLSVAADTSQLRALLDGLYSFVQIAALPESVPTAARLAWEAAQRSASDIQRLLDEMRRKLQAGD